MSNIREKTELAIPIIVTIYILSLLRTILIESYFVGVIVAYIAGAAIVVAGAGVILLIFNILHSIAASKGVNMSPSVKSLLYWSVAIVGGTLIYRRLPWFGNVHEFVFESLPDFVLQPTEFLTRLMPSAFGSYSTAIYIALFTMFLVGIICSIFDESKGLLNVLSSIKIPLFLCALAMVISIAFYSLIGFHLLWASIFIIMIFGQHKILAKTVNHIKFTADSSSRVGFKLYLSIRHIAGTNHQNPIDNVAAFVLAGLALLIQALLVIAFIIFVISNFNIMQDTIMQWFAY